MAKMKSIACDLDPNTKSTNEHPQFLPPFNTYINLKPTTSCLKTTPNPKLALPSIKTPTNTLVASLEPTPLSIHNHQ